MPRGPLPGYMLGDPWPGRIEAAEARRLSLPPPRDDERGDLDAGTATDDVRPIIQP